MYLFRYYTVIFLEIRFWRVVVIGWVELVVRVGFDSRVFAVSRAMLVWRCRVDGYEGDVVVL